MAKIGYKRGVSDLISYMEVDRFKDGYMMLEQVDQLCFERFDPTTDFKSWERGRLFTKDDELKWLKRTDGFHLVMTTENKLSPGFHLFRDDLRRVVGENGNPRPDRRVYLWGEKEFDFQKRPQDRWYEARIPEVLDYPLDGTQSTAKRVCVKVREYEITEQDPNGRLFVSIIHRYVGLEEG